MNIMIFLFYLLAPVGLRFQSDRVSAVEGASADLCIVATNNGDQDVTVSGLIVGPGEMITQVCVHTAIPVNKYTSL